MTQDETISPDTRRRLRNLECHKPLINLIGEDLISTSCTRDLPRLTKSTTILSNVPYHVLTTATEIETGTQVPVRTRTSGKRGNDDHSEFVTTIEQSSTSSLGSNNSSSIGGTTLSQEEKVFAFIEQLSNEYNSFCMRNRRRVATIDHDAAPYRQVSLSEYDEMSLALLNTFGSEQSMVIRILKCMQQSTIMHVLTTVKQQLRNGGSTDTSTLTAPNNTESPLPSVMTKDVNGSWNVTIYFPPGVHNDVNVEQQQQQQQCENGGAANHHHSQKICVCHRRREQVIARNDANQGGRFHNLFQFEWQMCFFLNDDNDADSQEDHEEDHDSESSRDSGSNGVFDVFVQLLRTDIDVQEHDISSHRQIVSQVFATVNDCASHVSVSDHPSSKIMEYGCPPIDTYCTCQ